VDVGARVIPHPQATKLTEPGKGALHYRPPSAQATPVRGSTHRDTRHDMALPQPMPNRRRVVAAIPDYTVRPLPRSAAFAVQRGNRGEHLPGDSAAEDKENAGQTRAIRDARPPASWPTSWSCQKRFDKIPQRIWKERGRHIPDATSSRRGSGFRRFCYALLRSK
jgi:hypothetical protein